MSDCPFHVGDIDKLPVDELFSCVEIRAKREQLKKSMRKAVDRWYKVKYVKDF